MFEIVYMSSANSSLIMPVMLLV